MKKVISILLACMMLMGSISLIASAATITGVVTWDNHTTTVADPETFATNCTVTLVGTWTIDENATVTIGNNATVNVVGEGTIINRGKIIVQNGGNLSLQGNNADNLGTYSLRNEATGTLEVGSTSNVTIAKNSAVYNAGYISHPERISIIGNLTHSILIPGSFTEDYTAAEMWNRTPTTVSFTVSYALDHSLSSDLDYMDATNYATVNTDTTINVSYGDTLYILITPEDGDGNWVDVGRMKLTAGGQATSSTAKLDNTRGLFVIQPTNAMKLGIYSTSYKDIVKIFEIELPRTEGYYCATLAGEEDSVTVEYGKTFSFHVVVGPDYDKSEPYAYINTIYLEPDEYGYYDITGPIIRDANGEYGMATAGGVQEDLTIQILGISKNSMKETVNSVVSFIQQIFAVIENIFSYFKDLFTGGSADIGSILDRI